MTYAEQFREAVQRIRAQAEHAQGRYEQAAFTVEDTEARLQGLEHQHELLDGVISTLHTMEEVWRRSLEEALSHVVSRGLSLVLGVPTTLHIESSQRGGLPSLLFRLEQGGLITDIVGARGGTVVNITNFLLRLGVMLAVQPPLRRLLILDEAFSHVSAEYVPALAALLRQLCDEIDGLQVVLVTHEPAYADVADVVYEVSQQRGVSHYTKVKDRRDIV